MTITRKDLEDHLWKVGGWTRPQAEQLVDAFFEHMRAAIITDSELKLSGFGRFTVRAKSPRPGRNPKTGQPCEIKARRVVTFSASALLRAKTNPNVPHSRRLRHKTPQ
ncbi:integration host factor subunit alpha [Acidithiobacillus sp. 'AMD consortium']|jgi:Bacterial nucleoid DNA-binding protein|uniref:integration host factor subunit alpha n=1 Tax=Acidithiobacillus TaxID=119977 RepID=UPI000AD0C273|nr:MULTISPECIES: integration host factor subunit alpha [Acidithiobacillus]MBU2773437.1 integration host factor subunit alpha [Acidithiobacillus ferrooxidans]MBU2808613.1 integration host factor subunit alpha [Acidithiobacillus ferrooxidans F221]MBU2855988.1 integration host factor subunit alpha [Acidithiobacillus ferrooxidans]MBU2860870.1 integration host factor subunit alpha [Acidithiobacillus ferrooxidans]MCR1343395.1 integration host factor subunit alpha [Acidithiobacillus ferrooxidans]